MGRKERERIALLEASLLQLQNHVEWNRESGDDYVRGVQHKADRIEAEMRENLDAWRENHEAQSRVLANLARDVRELAERAATHHDAVEVHDLFEHRTRLLERYYVQRGTDAQGKRIFETRDPVMRGVQYHIPAPVWQHDEEAMGGTYSDR